MWMRHYDALPLAFGHAVIRPPSVRKVAASFLCSSAASLSLAACRTNSISEAASVPTLPAGQLARNIETYKGQILRVCGRLLKEEGNTLWEIRAVADPHPHGAGVKVVPCAGAKPQRPKKGCMTGHIARRDGSLEPQAGGPVMVTDAIESYVWFLHPQCPAVSR